MTHEMAKCRYGEETTELLPCLVDSESGNITCPAPAGQAVEVRTGMSVLLAIY